ncbi:hypothetical protein EIP91_000879 [Steccherinum ochraceum]|uniref:Uncharacterized protein n=1 Tax=Steccherinum ochraceum TaxID=92696 RepID=A0A4R0RQD8_9APHY|nr:hypothetical protein EIP91_000879 [Steccherinum ochraceum]
MDPVSNLDQTEAILSMHSSVRKTTVNDITMLNAAAKTSGLHVVDLTQGMSKAELRTLLASRFHLLDRVGGF